MGFNDWRLVAVRESEAEDVSDEGLCENHIGAGVRASDWVLEERVVGVLWDLLKLTGISLTWF